MSSGHLHVGDVDKTIRCRVKDGDGNAVPLTGPTITVRFQKPDAAGTTVDVTAAMVGDGSTGEATVTTAAAAAADRLALNVAGTWIAQLKDGAGPWYYDVAMFEVLVNL